MFFQPPLTIEIKLVDKMIRSTHFMCYFTCLALNKPTNSRGFLPDF